MLKKALEYAAKGILVFPVHTINSNGECSCSIPECKQAAKHPRIVNGLKGASCDESIINKWWGVYKESNIGIPTGKINNIVVVDIDFKDICRTLDDVSYMNGIEFPKTLTSVTGNGNLHLIYKYPENKDRVKNSVDLFKNKTGVDIRGDGGYIVAPPSIHKSTMKYFWDNMDDEFDFNEISECPEWVYKESKAMVIENNKQEWKPSNKLPKNAKEALDACSKYSSSYDTWIKVGMAIHFTDPSNNGLSLWDKWSKNADNYDKDSVYKQWDHFNHRKHKSNSVCTFDTIYYYAEKCGWENPDIKKGMNLAKKILNNSKSKRLKKPISAPTNLIPKTGLLSDISNYILETSCRPQPILAIGSAISFLGTLCGKIYETETGLRTNFYIVGIAESGMGKDHARKTIKNIAYESDCIKYIGGEDFASGQSIVAALERTSSQMFMIDEFGMKLKNSTDSKAPGYLRDIISTLLMLYSSAGSVYCGREYADQKSRPKMEIHNPIASIYGTTVPSEFYESLKSTHTINGTLSRFLIFEAEKGRPIRNRPTLNKVPSKIINKLKKLDSLNEDRKTKKIILGDSEYKFYEELDDYCTTLMKCPVSNALFSRVGENALKLSLIYAISKNMSSPEIDIEALEWGSDIALWTANLLMNKVQESISDNDNERNLKKVLKIIKDQGKDGCRRSDLTKKTQFINRRDRDEIIETLNDSNQIRTETCESTTKPITLYIYNN